MKDSFISNYMIRAVDIAGRGSGRVNPNPLVGAVIVNGGKIIGEGWHKKYGGLHAERNAIADAVKKAGGDKSVCSGAEMYVTLEPCCHTGRQPPCTEAVVAAGIKKVFVGSSDPNPLVAGKGVAALRGAGVEVTENVMRRECDRLNRIFFHYITSKTPYVILKYAMSMNGVVAVRDGVDKNISGGASHDDVHKTRASVMAVMTGAATVLADDPMLNARLQDVRQPVRIVCDTNLRIPLDSRLVQSAKELPLIVACSENAAAVEAVSAKAKALETLGAQVLRVPCDADNAGRIDLVQLMKMLGALGIDSVLLESGGALSEAMLRRGLVQKAQVYVSPKFFGAACRKDSVLENSAEKFISYFGAPVCIRPIGDDVLIEYEAAGCA